MTARISIIVPGLFDLPPDEPGEVFVRERLPGLNRLLGLADALPNRAFDIDAIIAGALGINVGGGLPLAQAQLEAGDAAAARALLGEAVHLRPDLRSAVLVPIEKSQRNLDDINILIRDLSDLFKVDFNIRSLPGGRLLMRLDSVTAPRHYPHLLSVLGKSASPYIEQSRTNLPWYRLLNEIQMFLHQHPVNAQRVADGQLAINSLWFWGGGPAPSAKIAAGWFGDDAELERFAERLGLATYPLDAFASIPASGDAIVVDLRLLETLKAARGGALDTLLLELEERIFAPALARLERGRARLRLSAGFDADFELGPWARWRFWRRPRSPLDWQPGDAGG